jgi:hypothetical protein
MRRVQITVITYRITPGNERSLALIMPSAALPGIPDLLGTILRCVPGCTCLCCSVQFCLLFCTVCYSSVAAAVLPLSSLV